MAGHEINLSFYTLVASSLHGMLYELDFGQPGER